MRPLDDGGTPKVCAHTTWNGVSPTYCERTDVALIGTVWLCPEHEGINP